MEGKNLFLKNSTQALKKAPLQKPFFFFFCFLETCNQNMVLFLNGLKKNSF